MFDQGFDWCFGMLWLLCQVSVHVYCTVLVERGAFRSEMIVRVRLYPALWWLTLVDVLSLFCVEKILLVKRKP